MASEQIYIRPRRGTKTTMHETEKGSLVLKEGEMFFEFPDDGVGKGPAKVKIGDGSSAYVALPYALGDAIETEPVDFLEDHRDDFDEIFADMNSGITVQFLVPFIKRCLDLLHQALNALTQDLDDNYYTKTESDANYYYKDEVYNRTESDSNYYYKSDVYTKTESDNNYYYKEDVYTKTESDNNYYYKADVYTKSEIDQLIANYYTKAEVDSIILIPVGSTDPTNPKIGQQWIKT